MSFFVKQHTMKHVFACIILAICLQAPEKPVKQKTITSAVPPVRNLFIITIDGFRSQEMFNGTDSSIINDERYSQDTHVVAFTSWDVFPLIPRPSP